MPRRPVSPTDAEAYELPTLPKTNPRDFDDEDEDHEGVKVSSRGHAEDNESEDSGAKDGRIEEEEGLLEHQSGYRGEVLEEEIVGKGTKIDQLIADSVPSTDDPSLPSLTIRTVFLGSFFCVIGASASQIFYFKSNAPQFSSYFVILATYPLGRLLANERIIKPHWRIAGIKLNPGRFSIKEAILVSVISSSGAASAYATDILAIMDLYFHTTLSATASIVILLTTQCIGFGLAGMVHNLLVSPPAMYWPSTLVVVQLFTTLYPTPSTTASASTSRTQRILTTKRFQVFLVIFVAVFLYQFLPFLLFPTLTSISVLCLINNKSWWMRTLGSAYDGLGIMDFSFDWSSIGTAGPLYTPYWALGNYFGGLIGMVWVIVPLMLIFNFWEAREFPSAISPGLFTSAFKKFDVTAVLHPDLSLNIEAFEKAAPLLLTPLFAISYALNFAALSSVLVHVWLWHRDEIRHALSNKAELNDTHNKLMRAYLPVPHLWYLGLLGANFGAAVILVKTTPLQMPIWALTLSIAIAALFLIPVGVIAAVSNTQIGLNVLTEFVAGVLMPGKPIGNVTFKCFGYMAMSQALGLVSDLKLGWYTSIPPREMFACQILGTVLGALTNYFTLVSVINEKRPYLDGTLVDPTGQWTGRSPAVFYSASIIWGAVAPARFFVGRYLWLYAGFGLGAIVPLACFWAHKRWPGWKLHKVVFPIICHGASQVPQYPSNIILTSVAFTVAAHGWIAKRYPKSWNRYVYVVSSALDAGTSITALTIYFLFGVLTQWDGPTWWGNPNIPEGFQCLLWTVGSAIPPHHRHHY